MEDSEIVQRYLDRDESAIEFSAEKYGARLRALSFGITSDLQTSEECENDTYMQAWNRIPPNEPRTYLYAFLARIARHISIDRCRERECLKRYGYIVELSEEMKMCIPSPENVENAFALEVLGKEISNYLYTISQEKRVMFVRRYFYFDSLAEISKRCAVSESKVKSSLFRTRNGLREFLLKEGYIL